MSAPRAVQPQRTGFTLLEVLLAIGLLGIVATSAMTWAVAQGRSSRLAQERLAALTSALACTRLLDDDIVVGVARSEQEQTVHVLDPHTLTISTLHAVAGEEPGRRLVTWRFDADHHRFTRSSETGDEPIVPAARLLSEQFSDVTFVTSPAAELRLRVVANTAEGTTWTFPLWIERR